MQFPVQETQEELAKRIGHDILGPVVQRWLLGLHQYISYYDDGQTEFLYCARAGVRIEKLYRLFLEGAGLWPPVGQMIWVSRVSACKGTFSRSKIPAARMISREYQHQPIADLIRGVFRYQPEILSSLDLDLIEYKAHGEVFPGWIEGPTPAATQMRNYFERCGRDFDGYIASLLDGKRRAVLIDSGWQGSMQSLLTKAYPEIKWRGLYFGRHLLNGHDASIVDDVLGIMFESDVYSPKVKETAFIRHRHIIESLLEPSGPSIEEIPGGLSDSIVSNLIEANQNETVTDQSDPLYLGVVEYLTGSGRGATISEIFARHQHAMAELARILITPTREEALALSYKDRSADFGKQLIVPVLIDPADGEGSEQRISRALWQEGQAALEYKGGFLRDTQLRLAGCENLASYFDPVGSVAIDQQDAPTVAVITRTKNRPLLLRRAAESVAKQNYANFIWAVVNDGGDEAVVRQVLLESGIDQRRIILVSNASSVGMEAASNIGISNCSSEFVVIHDDDDSWEPGFLEETVRFLTSPRGARYGGVIAHTTYISEEINGSSVVEHERRPYMDWVRNVQLSEMAVSNMFPPIAFLFRRRVWEEVGGYNDQLPVLGDWYFNLEFLLRADIGVIPKSLANYHHRDRGEQTAYANSVIAGISKHEEFAAVARNAFIRRNGNSFPGAIAAILGYFASDIRHVLSGRPGTSAVNYEIIDKYWVVAHLNNPLTEKWYSKRRYFPVFLSPDISWQELEIFARKAKKTIPSPYNFDEQRYLHENEDVAIAVRNGRIKSGYHHYISHGRGEGRPRTSI